MALNWTIEEGEEVLSNLKNRLDKEIQGYIETLDLMEVEFGEKDGAVELYNKIYTLNYKLKKIKRYEKDRE